MADDKLIPSGGTESPPLAPVQNDDLYGLAPRLPEEEEEGGVDLRRYIYALWRHKWLLLAAALMGGVGAAAAWMVVPVGYTATGNLWIQADRQASSTGDVQPIRQSGLFRSNAWIDLLRSYSVLDPVVIQERMYLTVPKENGVAFSSFELADQFQPGSYRLTIGEDGRQYTLATKQGAVLERGALGDPIGARLGFRWSPEAGAFPAGTRMDFSVATPREASNDLRDRLLAHMDPQGNFVGLSLQGTDPQRIASILNALMDRYVAIAGDLKKSKLDEILGILQEQLRYAQQELEQAEQNLEEFRVATITLPSDNSTPIAPGLEETRDPVFGSYFRMKVDLEQLRRDRQRLQAIVDSLPQSGVRIEALEGIPAVAASVELRPILDELVNNRSQLRVLRDRYSDDYPPIQELLTRIRTIETQAIPRVVSGILAEMTTQQHDLQARVDSASSELTAIPPRTIEEARLRRRVAIQQNLYNELRSRVETARLASASSIPDLQILDRASAPEQPTDDKRLQLAAVILMGVFGAAIGGVILLDHVDPRVRYPLQVSREMGLDILGSIPRVSHSHGARGEENAAHVLEAFRELRLTIGFAYGSAGPLTLVITSPAQGEGKSLISTNLAVAYAEVGRRTLLIDADTRRGDAHRLLARNRSPGLTDYLRERTSGDIIQTTEYDRLHFVGSGTRSGSTPELLASPRMTAFLGTLKRAYDVIIVDTPPLAAGGDAVLLGAMTGNMAIVIRNGSTEKPLVLVKLEALSRLPIRILGAILNDVEPNSAHYRYYSSYLPGYEPGAEEDANDEGRPPLLADVGGSDQAS